MPLTAPGTLPAADYAAIMAYMLAYECVKPSGDGKTPFPAGDVRRCQRAAADHLWRQGLRAGRRQGVRQRFDRGGSTQACRRVIAQVGAIRRSAANVQDAGSWAWESCATVVQP